MSIMARKKKPTGPKRVRAGTAINVYVDDALGDALDAYLESTEPRVSKTAYIEALIKADLRRLGRWPVQQTADSGS